MRTPSAGADDRPADDRPADDRPADDRPADDRPGPRRPVGRRRVLRPSRVVRAVVALILLAAVAATAPSSPPRPLDPRSTAPDGTKALVLLLGRLGAHVGVGALQPPSGRGVALLLQDRLGPADRAALRRWVDAGGALVVTDPLSPLAGVSDDGSTQNAVTPTSPRGPGCDLEAVRDVRSLDTSGARLLRAGPGQLGCFRAGQGDFVVARAEGAGTIVVLASAAPWTNADLADADDSVLAAGLLAPEPTTIVTVVGASPVGGGQTGLIGLISPRLVEAFWGLIGAFVLLVAWRARRLGRPVADAVPVELPGSGLVAATGNLLQEGAHRGEAATLLRADMRRLLAERLGAAPDLPPGAAAAVASARTGVPADRILAALEGPTPPSDAALLGLARMIEQTRQELSSAR